MQASRPANAGPNRELTPLGNAAPPLGAAAPPPPVHHDLAPRPGAPRPDAPSPGAPSPGAPPTAAPRVDGPHVAVSRPGVPRAAAGHRAARPRQPTDRADSGVTALAWIPYLIVLAGVAAGMFVAWRGSQYAGRGAGLVGSSLLVAALARLILAPRYT